MVGTTINGLKIADEIKNSVKRSVFDLQSHEIDPCLATILVGDDLASSTYVKKKHDACKEVGIVTADQRMRSDITQQELNAVIQKLNSDKMVHGILLQLPLPNHLDASEAISLISPAKDVDGLTSHNMGLLALGKATLIPCTPLAVMDILERCKVDLEGKTVIVINRSNLIGKPLYQLLLQKNASVIACHSKTTNLARLCRQADVVITAVGNRQIFTLTPDMLKDGCTIIDVAITRYNGKLTGDADYENVVSMTSYITPVPGGVGPVTVAMLLKNTIAAASAIRK